MNPFINAVRANDRGVFSLPLLLSIGVPEIKQLVRSTTSRHSHVIHGITDGNSIDDPPADRTAPIGCPSSPHLFRPSPPRPPDRSCSLRRITGPRNHESAPCVRHPSRGVHQNPSRGAARFTPFTSCGWRVFLLAWPIVRLADHLSWVSSHGSGLSAGSIKYHWRSTRRTFRPQCRVQELLTGTEDHRQ